MAESTVVRTKRDVTWIIQDAAAAHTYTPPVVPGNFSYEAALYDLVRIKDNGALYGVRKGDDQPLTCSFGTYLTDIGSATYATMPDLCEERGYVGTTWVSTTANASDVDTYDLIATIDGTLAGESDKTATFDDMIFRKSGGSFEYPATYDVSGESATSTKPTVA